MLHMVTLWKDGDPPASPRTARRAWRAGEPSRHRLRLRRRRAGVNHVRGREGSPHTSSLRGRQRASASNGVKETLEGMGGK